MQISLKLDDELFIRLDKLANETQRSKSFYIKKALATLLDDFDDYKDAIKSLKENQDEKYFTIDEIASKYGILLWKSYLTNRLIKIFLSLIIPCNMLF